MILDSSALIAILLNEPEAERFEQAIGDAEFVAMSAATAFECSIVLESRLGPVAGVRMDLYLREAEVTVIPFDTEQLLFARTAFRRFGRGRHPAQLNMGDCFAYALAKQQGMPLLFKGNDFAQTDVESVF